MNLVPNTQAGARTALSASATKHLIADKAVRAPSGLRLARAAARLLPKTPRWAAIVVLPAMLQPAPAFACAVCYGASDSPLAQGMNWGILTLLGVVASVLALVFAFFVHVGRNAAKLRAAERSPHSPDKLP